MKIAVTYENGEVFQHFGRTESFKIYEVEDGKVISSEVIGTDGTGHEELADFLADRDVNAVICGGLGDGALAALADAGIEVTSGVSGNTDAAVEAFLNGELVSEGVNCDHHDHEHHHHEEEEDCGCGGDCGCGCESCGGCHSFPMFDGRNVGKTCKTHYIGTFNDGTEFDSSYNRGEPLEFVCGMGMMIPGFDKAVADMEVGETAEIHLMPEDAYGYPDPMLIFTVEISMLPGSENLTVGEQVVLYDDMGRPTQVTVAARDDTTITFDANHEMAGKELNFKIELVSVE